MRLVWKLSSRVGRTAVVIFLAVLGSTLLVRFAPGYWSDAREMDSHYAEAARRELSNEALRSASIPHLLAAELTGYFHGNLGESREYEVPVKDLLQPRLAVTGSLMLRSIGLAWIIALAGAIACSSSRKSSPLSQIPSTLLLAVPTSALVTLCLLVDHGGPVLVMTLVLAARDFKFMKSLLDRMGRAPHMLQARAQGLRSSRLLVAHILPGVRTELLALATLSFVTGLSALVPVEVLFSVPGIGQLAWNAAMNRDLPVLLAVTVLMAIAVTLAGIANEGQPLQENA